MEDILISIIVPVYNTENYIDKCVESILTQSYQHFELLLLNDGSTDNSYSHLLKYKDDPRITIVNKTNTGQSDTRFQGLLLAKGEYVFFVDSDDTIEPYTLCVLTEDALKHNADVAYARYRLVDEKGNVLREQAKYSLDKIVGRENIVKDALLLRNFKSSLCLKLIKRDLLTDVYDDYVKNTYFNEDVLISALLATHCGRASFNQTIVYNVLQRSNSLSRTVKPEVITIHNSLFKYIKTRLVSICIFKNVETEFFYGYAKSVLFGFVLCAIKSTNYKQFRQLADLFVFDDVIKKDNCNSLVFKYPLLYRIMTFIIKRKQILYTLCRTLKWLINF